MEKIIGEDIPKYRVFRCTRDGEMLNEIHATDDPSDAYNFVRRQDYLYAYQVNGRRVDEISYRKLVDEAKCQLN